MHATTPSQTASAPGVSADIAGFSGSPKLAQAAHPTFADAAGGCGLMMLSSMSMRVCTAALMSAGTAAAASTRTALAAGGLPSSGCAICRRALMPLATAVTAASSAARRLRTQQLIRHTLSSNPCDSTHRLPRLLYRPLCRLKHQVCCPRLPSSIGVQLATRQWTTTWVGLPCACRILKRAQVAVSDLFCASFRCSEGSPGGGATAFMPAHPYLQAPCPLTQS